MQAKTYSSKEKTILFWFMLPYTVINNLLLFGNNLFASPADFFKTFFISALYFGLAYALFGIIARIVQVRYPDPSLLFKRIVIMLLIFFVLNLFLLQGLYLIYELVGMKPRWGMQWWAAGFACCLSTVITFINEAAVGWENWKNAVIETEQIKNAYQKTKLLALKGQVNPHFLFNCFNSLSSLINEDEAKAEKFLDEMTKVHRYMLRNDDDQLTTLQQEIHFANSYLHLISERFGRAIETSISIQPVHAQLLLPPLSMQTILENIIYNNTATKTSPLKVKISTQENYLVIEHSLHLKSRGNSNIEDEEGLDNLIKKYELLNGEKVVIKEAGKSRWIILPLISSKKEVDI